MSALLSTVQKTVGPTADYVGKEVSTRYSKLIQENQQYIVKDKAAADKLLRQWFFTRLSRLGPSQTSPPNMRRISCDKKPCQYKHCVHLRLTLLPPCLPSTHLTACTKMPLLSCRVAPTRAVMRQALKEYFWVSSLTSLS